MKSLIGFLIVGLTMASTFVDDRAIVFKKEKWLLGEQWEKAQEVEVHMIAGPEQLEVFDKATGELLFDIRWDSIMKLTCSCTRYLRARKVAFILKLFDLPYLNLNGTKHWLALGHAGSTTIFRLHKNTRDLVITEFENRTGLICERIEFE